MKHCWTIWSWARNPGAVRDTTQAMGKAGEHGPLMGFGVRRARSGGDKQFINLSKEWGTAEDGPLGNVCLNFDTRVAYI